MPEDTSKTYRERAIELLKPITGIEARDRALAATAAVGYALLAILDDVHAIREHITPSNPPQEEYTNQVLR